MAKGVLNGAAVKALLAEAQLNYDEALRRGPDDESAVPALLGRGCLNLRLGKLAYAAADLAEAARRQPNNALAHNSLGVLRIAEGNFPEAAAEFRSALHLAPGLQLIRGNMSLLAKLAGDQALAREAAPSTETGQGREAHSVCGASQAARDELGHLAASLPGEADKRTLLFALRAVEQELVPQIWSLSFASSRAVMIVKRATAQGKQVELIRQIAVSPGSPLKTKEGAGTGDTESRIRDIYGEPDHTEFGPDEDYLVYCNRGLSFGTRKGTVVKWFAFQ